MLTHISDMIDRIAGCFSNGLGYMGIWRDWNFIFLRKVEIKGRCEVEQEASSSLLRKITLLQAVSTSNNLGTLRLKFFKS